MEGGHMWTYSQGEVQDMLTPDGQMPADVQQLVQRRCVHTQCMTLLLLRKLTIWDGHTNAFMQYIWLTGSYTGHMHHVFKAGMQVSGKATGGMFAKQGCSWCAGATVV